MRRWKHDDNGGNRVAKVVGMLALAGAGVFLLTQINSLRRYIHIRRMSARRHPRPPGTVREAADAPPRWGTTHWPMH
ncbi:MAG TPA: hypothetical protein VGL86_23615 [Polyangia bacterium]|jgi:hypothetical protein